MRLEHAWNLDSSSGSVFITNNNIHQLSDYGSPSNGTEAFNAALAAIRDAGASGAIIVPPGDWNLIEPSGQAIAVGWATVDYGMHPPDFTIGVVLGPSGSGKTIARTLAQLCSKGKGSSSVNSRSSWLSSARSVQS